MSFAGQLATSASAAFRTNELSYDSDARQTDRLCEPIWRPSGMRDSLEQTLLPQIV